VRRDEFHVDGETLASVTTISADTNLTVSRQFCRQCGSPIASLSETMPELALIKAGTLCDRTWLEPAIEVWCNSAQPRVRHEPETRRCFGRGVTT